MKNVRTLRKRRAVSPVIATVILVAVTITVAVAVSYWMSGITGQYTSFEKIEIQSALCDYVDTTDPNEWQLTILLKNSGTKTATLTNVFVNDAVLTYVASDEFECSVDPANTLQIESGDSKSISITIFDDDAYTSLSSGTTINVKIHSAAGMDYIRLVQLT